MIIIGAGLAGLLAAHAWPNAQVFEADSEPRMNHAALLRFRGDAVSKLVGIEFRRVRVHKGIWLDGAYVEPSIRAANMYSRKILAGRVADRSIWNIAASDRWVAPESLYEELVENIGKRVFWGAPFDLAGFSARRRADAKLNAISTAPLPVAMKELMPALAADVTFERAPITVDRFRLSRTDVFQTVYFPTPAHSAYRASITGDLLIVEHAGAAAFGEWLNEVVEAFNIHGSVSPIGTVKQSYGKIAPINDSLRKRLLFSLTHEHGIYSLGRFATWRNILLDDVVDDIAVVKRLMRSSNSYDVRRNTA